MKPSGAQALNAALLVGLGASLAVVAPRMWAHLAPQQPTATSVTTSPPPAAAIEAPRYKELSILPPLLGGDSVARVIANRVMEPCLRESLSRWVFPRERERYATELAFVVP
jgi:hypothetical protein